MTGNGTTIGESIFQCHGQGRRTVRMERQMERLADPHFRERPKTARHRMLAFMATPISARMRLKPTSSLATTGLLPFFSACRSMEPARNPITPRWRPRCSRSRPERISMSPADTLVTPFEFGPVGPGAPMPSAAP